MKTAAKLAKSLLTILMPYPLIIYGAGASYGYLDIKKFSGSDQIGLSQWKAPLINNIFDASRFGQIIGKYDDIKPLASAVINITSGETPFDFEQYLTDLEEKYPENSYAKIMALRFYLAELFGKVSHHYFRHTNNHNHLIDEIRNRAGKACIVNFNYDTLFEKNIKDIGSSNNLESYVQGDIKVIKVHGAHNWGFNPIYLPGKQDVYDYFISKARELNEQYNGREIYPTTVGNFDYQEVDFNIQDFQKYNEEEGQWMYFLPAVAIPIGTKAAHVCPKNHITVLEKELTLVDRILLIGWRAQDEFLIELLKKHLQPNINLTIVSSNEAKAREVALKFKDITQINYQNIQISKREGYTAFLANREYETFFS